MIRSNPCVQTSAAYLHGLGLLMQHPGAEARDTASSRSIISPSDQSRPRVAAQTSSISSVMDSAQSVPLNLTPCTLAATQRTLLKSDFERFLRIRTETCPWNRLAKLLQMRGWFVRFQFAKIKPFLSCFCRPDFSKINLHTIRKVPTDGLGLVV